MTSTTRAFASILEPRTVGVGRRVSWWWLSLLQEKKNSLRDLQTDISCCIIGQNWVTQPPQLLGTRIVVVLLEHTFITGRLGEEWGKGDMAGEKVKVRVGWGGMVDSFSMGKKR
jgi:hypothetical protein